MTEHRLSRPLVRTALGSVLAGVAVGAALYATRSSTRAHHTAGTEAWPQHGVVAGVALLVLVLVVRRRRAAGRHGEPLLLAAVSARAGGRLRATQRRPGPRAVAAIALVALLIYCGVRAGMQVTAGLDPNFTANAWGGPGYLGAMVCHYLDGALIALAAAGSLDRVLLRDPSEAPRKTPDVRKIGDEI